MQVLVTKVERFTSGEKSKSAGQKWVKVHLLNSQGKVLTPMFKEEDFPQTLEEVVIGELELTEEIMKQYKTCEVLFDENGRVAEVR